MNKLVFINMLGKNSDEDYIYEFYFSHEPELFWGLDFEVKPASICNIKVPDKMTYEKIETLKTDILLNLSQKNCCFSMQDCKDKIIPVAWENLDNCEEYPEDGRIVFPFGMDIDDINIILAKRNIAFE